MQDFQTAVLCSPGVDSIPGLCYQAMGWGNTVPNFVGEITKGPCSNYLVSVTSGAPAPGTWKLLFQNSLQAPLSVMYTFNSTTECVGSFTSGCYAVFQTTVTCITDAVTSVIAEQAAEAAYSTVAKNVGITAGAVVGAATIAALGFFGVRAFRQSRQHQGAVNEAAPLVVNGPPAP